MLCWPWRRLLARGWTSLLKILLSRRNFLRRRMAFITPSTAFTTRWAVPIFMEGNCLTALWRFLHRTMSMEVKPTSKAWLHIPIIILCSSLITQRKVCSRSLKASGSRLISQLRTPTTSSRTSSPWLRASFGTDRRRRISSRERPWLSGPCCTWICWGFSLLLL